MKAKLKKIKWIILDAPSWLISEPKLLIKKQILQIQTSAEILPNIAIEQNHCYNQLLL